MRKYQGHLPYSKIHEVHKNLVANIIKIKDIVDSILDI